MNLIANNLTYKPDNEFHLKDVSFNFKKGNLYTILGRTLSGKTTLLKTIAGLLNPDSGKIQFEEKEFNKIPVWERNVAMVYQQFINYPHLSVYENISFPLKQRKLDKDKIKNDVNEALKTVGLVGFENRKIQELSGGQQQRVALARSLAKKAKILLLDEPTVENFLIAQSIYGVFCGLFGIYLSVKGLKITKLKKRDFLKYINGVKSEYKKIRYDQIIGLIPQHFDVIILAIVLDLQTVGIYQFAKRLVEPINYLVVTFNPWLQNKLKIQDKNFKIRSFFFQILVPLSIVLIAVYNLIGKNIILLIGNEEFLDSYNPMLILLVGFITYLLTFWIRQYLLFYGLIQFHAYGRIIYSITFVLLALLLSESYSSLGIAYSLSGAMVVQKLFEIIIFKTKITKFI